MFILYGRYDTYLIPPRLFKTQEQAYKAMKTQVEATLNEIFDEDEEITEIVDKDTGCILYIYGSCTNFAEVDDTWAVVRDDSGWLELEITEVEAAQC